MGPARGSRQGGAVALSVLLCVAGSARAQVPGEEIARRAFEDGVSLEKKGEYAAALAKFRESSLIKATLGNRFHTAYCLEMTGKLGAALTEYEAVDKAAREQRKSDVIEATRVRAEPLRPRVPQLSIHVVPSVPPDLEVILDDAALSPVLLDGRAFRVDPGEHDILGRAPDRQTFSKHLTIAEGTSATVDVLVEPIVRPAPAVEQKKPAPHESRWSRSETLAIASAGGAAFFATAGIVAFVVAGSTQSDAEEDCKLKVSCDSEQSRVRTFDALALTGFIGAAGLAALSIVLWTTQPRTATVTASRLVTRPSWIGIEGRF